MNFGKCLFLATTVFKVFLKSNSKNDHHDSVTFNKDLPDITKKKFTADA